MSILTMRRWVKLPIGWWGQQDVPGAAYFRVTGPSIVLEYASQNDDRTVDHAHSMYREMENDYGSAWIGTR